MYETNVSFCEKWYLSFRSYDSTFNVSNIQDALIRNFPIVSIYHLWTQSDISSTSVYLFWWIFVFQCRWMCIFTMSITWRWQELLNITITLKYRESTDKVEVTDYDAVTIERRWRQSNDNKTSQYRDPILFSNSFRKVLQIVSCSNRHTKINRDDVHNWKDSTRQKTENEVNQVKCEHRYPM